MSPCPPCDRRPCLEVVLNYDVIIMFQTTSFNCRKTDGLDSKRTEVDVQIGTKDRTGKGPK